jgi:hypothetical protein
MDTAKLFDEKMERILKAVGTRKDTDLARALGISPQSIAGARKRQLIPGAWVETVAELFNVSADWLLFGEGQMLRPSREAAGETIAPRPTPPAACSRCEKLEGELEKERDLNRELVAETRQLWRENGDLRVELERAKARAAPEDTTPEDARDCA